MCIGFESLEILATEDVPASAEVCAQIYNSNLEREVVSYLNMAAVGTAVHG